MYKLSDVAHESGKKEYSKKWVYVGYVRAHTHDVQALTVAVPVVRKGLQSYNLVHSCSGIK